MSEIKKFLDAVDAHPEWGRIELTQPFIEEVRELMEESEGCGAVIRNLYMIIDRKEKLNKHYRAEIERLEKALDKACAQIAWLWNDYQCDQGSWDIKEWKEWLLYE